MSRDGFRPKGLAHMPLVLVQLVTQGHTEPVAILPDADMAKAFASELAPRLIKAGHLDFEIKVRPIPLYFKPGMNPITLAQMGN